jgi:major intracellular serine protease
MVKYLLLLLLSVPAFATEPLRVAVIDTGLDLNDTRFTSHLCSSGHWDFISRSNKIFDINGHGTHVAGLIQQYAKDSNYCLIILKYYSEFNTTEQNIINSIKAFRRAAELKVDIVNYSAGGSVANASEENILFTNSQITYIVAAGNENKKLDCKVNSFYPGCYNLPNVINVGCLIKSKVRCEFSNYGPLVKAWELGYNISSTLPDNKTGKMSGTSMSTAIYTGKFIYAKFH